MDRVVLYILIQTVKKSSHLYNKLVGVNSARKSTISYAETLGYYQNDSSDYQCNQESVLAVPASL